MNRAASVVILPFALLLSDVSLGARGCSRCSGCCYLSWGANKNFRRATLIAASTGRFFGFLFIVWGVWQALRGNVVNGLWIAFIGWFLESAAGAQVQQQMVQGLLGGHKVSEAMGNACTHVSGDTSLQKLIDQEVLTHGRQCFLVDRGDPRSDC